jgi:hypothetical protein
LVDIFEALKNKALARAHLCAPEAFVVRGLWRTDYVLRINERATLFHLHYVVAQTLGQGCSYYDAEQENPGLSESLIGSNALEVQTGSRCIDIALLDAVFSFLKEPPVISHVLRGTNMEKADQRARIVCNEALSLLKRMPSYKHGKRMTVVNVGVVGNFLAILANHSNIKLRASDFYRGVVDRLVWGVRIEHGSKTLDLVAGADLAIVTGMTLANNTLDAILNTALKSKTALVIFAETGANFASEYCKMGADIVISEPFPTYLTCAGRTEIGVYRRAVEEEVRS